MKAYKSYKFRAYPTKEQEMLISKTFGCCRFIYNKMLEDKIRYYKQTKQQLNNTPAQYKTEFGWLREVDSTALSFVQLHLRSAFHNFFINPKSEFPKFKKKRCNRQSYSTYNNGHTIYLVDNAIRLSKIGMLKIKQHRKIPDGYILKSATISKEPSGKYYVSIRFQYNEEIPNIILDKNKSIGLDYSSPYFYVDNQGNKAGYPKFYRKLLDKLSREQRRLDLMKHNSANYQKQRIKVAKIHEHIANQRKDWLHKLSVKIAREYDVVCIEDLDLSNLKQSLNLGKSTSDNGFGMFKTFLSYKLHDRGKLLSIIDKWFPSSKMCRFCGEINKSLTIKDRAWVCGCRHFIDRDTNAAINILNEGLRLAFD